MEFPLRCLTHGVKRDSQENVTQETQNMIPDTAGRLRSAVDDLHLSLDEGEDADESDEYKAAMDAVTTATSALNEE